MKKIWAGVAVGLALGMQVAQAREVRVLRDGWRFHQGDEPAASQLGFSDSSWESMVLPHTWNTDLIKNQVNGDYYLGVGWYRSQLPVTPDMNGQRLFIRFEGALTTADVFVNGQKAGRHEGGYTAFCFEVTDLINWCGVNTLAVKVDNSDNPNIIVDGSKLFTRFGGIYRPATLLVTDPTCVTPLDYASAGVYVRQDIVTDKRADVTVTTKVSNGLAIASDLVVTTRLSDATGRVVATQSGAYNVAAGQTIPAEQSLTVLTPHLWNGREDPYCYQVAITVSRDGKVVDQMSQPLGLRYFRVDANEGFLLNGHPLDLHGVSRHQEWEHEGSALTDAHHSKDVADIMEVGCTAVRLAHYPQAETMYDLCDQNGLIVWAEIPMVQGVRPNKGRVFDNAKQQLTEMIRQNYNHPSICFWGLYNECWIDADKVQVLHDLAKAEDPGRLTTAASNQRLSEKHYITDVICWNRYPIWYGSSMMDVWGDELHAAQPDLKIGVSEYGAGGCIDQHEQHTKRKPNPTKGRFFPEEYMNHVHELLWPQLAERPFIWGKFVWNMYDFSWPGVTRGSRINLNNKGLVTYDRQTRKDAFYYYKANWSKEPVLYITSRRHTVRTNAVTDVKVYSNCDQMELTLNKKKYRASNGAYGVTIWPDLPLQEGDNSVKVTGYKDGKKLEDSCVWNYDPTAESAPAVQSVETVDVSAVSASSYQQSKGATPEHAIDGKADTLWMAQGPHTPQWLSLDLLQETDLGGVKILWGNNGPYTYEVQVSNDGKKWVAVASAEKQTGQTKMHPFKATTRFLRVYCTATEKGNWVGIREIQVLAE